MLQYLQMSPQSSAEVTRVYESHVCDMDDVARVPITGVIGRPSLQDNSRRYIVVSCTSVMLFLRQQVQGTGVRGTIEPC